VILIREFLSWWARQLAELLPERLRRPDTVRADALLVVPDGPLDRDPPAVELLMRKRGQISRLGRFVLDASGVKSAHGAAATAGGPLPVRLRLPPGLLLEKHLALPLAAERELVRVIGYEMDRETPFAADEVYWDSTVEQRDRVNGRLRLRLSLVPKAPLLALVTGLQQAGLAPTALDVGLPHGEFRPIALAGSARRRGLVLTRAVPAAAIICVVLALIAVSVPFVRQAIDFSRVNSKIAELQPTVDEADGLRRRIEGNTAGGDVLVEQRAKLGDVLKLLAAMTQVLPDDTHLTDFTLRQRKITLNGQSAGAAKLIGALSQEPSIQNPTFAAPVTRNEGAKMDIFTITAEARP
jgi:general secretion pathway protein L